jgi:hypothetical protein
VELFQSSLCILLRNPGFGDEIAEPWALAVKPLRGIFQGWVVKNQHWIQILTASLRFYGDRRAALGD